MTLTECFPICLMRGVRPVVQGEEREEAVRPDRGLSAGPSSCRLVTVRATTFLLCLVIRTVLTGLAGLAGLVNNDHVSLSTRVQYSAVQGLNMTLYYYYYYYYYLLIIYLFIGSSGMEDGDIN